MYTNLSSKILLVPVQLDALLLKEPTKIADAMADFSKLPYSDGSRDYNSDIAYISEDIVSKPFHNQNTVLSPGIHLHWTLPDTLTHAVNEGDSLQFPIVPDLWLVSCKVDGNIQKQWIVESSFIHPTHESAMKSYCVIPLKTTNSSIPFHLLGRYLSYEEWLQDNVAHDYWDQLTAVGYGEPTFAALYSNCISVFGFFDSSYSIDNLPQNLEYEVVGWYRDASTDVLSEFVDIWQNNNNSQDISAFKDQLQQIFNWTYDSNDIPQQMACYSRLAISPQSSNTDVSDNLQVVMGNTVSEALSALVANELSIDSATKIEEQLESIQLATKIEQQILDLGAKFQEARHEKAFMANQPGDIWIVKYQQTEDSSESTQVTLPVEMAGILNELNTLQSQYDQLSDDLASYGLRLFCDWYKYMLCTHPPIHQFDYPDSDIVRFFIESVDFTAFDSIQNERGIITVNSDSNNVVENFEAKEENTIASTLAQQGNALIDAINTYNNGKSQQLILKAGQAPRYWQANEPVVLLYGDGISQTARHGLDGTLNCHLEQLSTEDLPSQLAQINATIAAFPNNDQGCDIYTQPPWNPFLLEWRAEFSPTTRNLDEGCYQNNHVTVNYTLPQDQPDFQENAQISYQQESNIYTGTSILTGNSGQSLNSSLENYLNKTVMQDYYRDQRVPEDEQNDTYLTENIALIIAWYIDPEKENECSYDNPVYTALYAYQKLCGLDYLAQSLGGFNQELLMLKQTLQLSIGDPLAFKEEQTFIDGVALRIGNLKNSPQPLLNFNPIRAGVLRLLDLNLVDTFGQIQKLNWTNILSAETLPKKDQNEVVLLPRFAQPARLNVRWLAASDDEQEMNSHPATTPICGWLLPNYLDNTLMVYDTSGTSLGAITMNSACMWQPNPGDANPKSVEQISNNHLQNLVGYIIQQGTEYLQVFLDNIQNSLQNIDPEIYAQHLGLSILMGRPIAVTRIKLDLQLQGLPANNQQWDAFSQDLNRSFRDTYHFEDVDISVRIGEYKQLNDGVVGYWIEDNNTEVSDVLYLPQSDAMGNDKIVSYHDHPLDLTLTINSEPIYMTVLFDPRGKLHATSGILPTKVIDIPADQFAAAFQNIDMSFLTSPIITGEAISLPLPPEPNYRWSWAEIQTNGYWREVSTFGTVHKEQVLAQWDNGEQVWDTLLDQGWLQLTTEDYQNEAIVVAIDKRPTDDLGELNDQKQMIDAFLQQTYLRTEGLQKLTSQRQMIKEGWLKLRKLPESSGE